MIINFFFVCYGDKDHRYWNFMVSKMLQAFTSVTSYLSRAGYSRHLILVNWFQITKFKLPKFISLSVSLYVCLLHVVFQYTAKAVSKPKA